MKSMIQPPFPTKCEMVVNIFTGFYRLVFVLVRLEVFIICQYSVFAWRDCEAS